MEFLLKIITLSLLFLAVVRPFYARRAVLENKDEYNTDFYHFIENTYAGLLSAIFAKVAKADGRVSEKEALYVGSFLSGLAEEFDEDKELARNILKSIFNKNKNDVDGYEDLVKNLYVQVSSNNDLKERSIQLLMGLAYIDNDFSDDEEALIRHISVLLRFNDEDYIRIKQSITEQYSDHKKLVNSYFQTLGISQRADNDSVKKAYRALVKSYHPDSIVGATDKELHEANVKLQKINEAYAEIKKIRMF